MNFIAARMGNKLVVNDIRKELSLKEYFYFLDLSKKLIGIRLKNAISNQPKESNDLTECEIYYNTINKISYDFVNEVLSESVNKAPDYAIEKIVNSCNSIKEWKDYNTNDLVPMILDLCREDYLNRFGFPVITNDCIDWIKSSIGTGPFVEVGAGNGYLASELISRDFNVVVTEPYKPNDNKYPLGNKEHCSIEQIDGETAIVKYNDCNLIWSWPSMSDHSHEILSKFCGEYFVFFGELSGCTGSPEFHRILDNQYSVVDIYTIPQWYGIHDRAVIFKNNQFAERR